MLYSLTLPTYLTDMKVVDLFSGCGGLSLGFQMAGFDVVAAYDNWDKAVATYRYNFAHPVFSADLMAYESVSQQIRNFAPDVIIGGPPCQDYSSAGKRDEDSGRAILTVCFAKTVAAVAPEWFVMENVHNIGKYRKIYDAVNILSSCGYGMSSDILDASYCGVPQRRKRFFLVGKKGEKDGFFDDYFRRNISDRAMTVADYFGDKFDVKAYYRHPRSYARRGIFSVNEPSPTIRGVNRPIPSGYKIHANDPVASLEGIRPLTTRERASIQTFPDNFEFFGSKTEVEQMIGNAVPVNLARFVAKALMDYVKQS